MSPAERSITIQTGQEMLRHKQAIAAALVDREFSRHPELAARYGAIAREKSLQDADYHLAYLASGVETV